MGERVVYVVRAFIGAPVHTLRHPPILTLPRCHQSRQSRMRSARRAARSAGISRCDYVTGRFALGDSMPSRFSHRSEAAKRSLRTPPVPWISSPASRVIFHNSIESIEEITHCDADLSAIARQVQCTDGPLELPPLVRSCAIGAICPG